MFNILKYVAVVSSDPGAICWMLEHTSGLVYTPLYLSNSLWLANAVFPATLSILDASLIIINDLSIRDNIIQLKDFVVLEINRKNRGLLIKSLDTSTLFIRNLSVPIEN